MTRGGVVGGAAHFRLLAASERCTGQTRQVDVLVETLRGSVVVRMLPASSIQLASYLREPGAARLTGW